MNENKILNKVRTLLGMEVKLEQMKLTDGVSVLEAEVFEAGNEVFIVTEDDQKIALPVGEYELENGMILVVTEEGLIAEIKEVAEEEEMPEAPAQEPAEMPEEMAAESAPKKTIESIVKETFFSTMEKLQAENEALKAELASMKEKSTEVAKEEAAPVELASEEVEVKPIQHNPENAQSVEMFNYAPKKQRSTVDAIFEKLSK